MGPALAGALALVSLLGGAARGQSVGRAARGSMPPALSRRVAVPPAQKSLEVLDADRYVARVAEYRGKPLMVTFWATWCEPCRDEFPMVNELVKQYKPKGLAVFGMDMDDDAEESLALRFLAMNHPVFPSYRKKPGKDEEFINRVNPKWSGVLPATFFYASDGRLVGQITGEQPRQVFVEAIEQLLSTSAKN
jgi:thiol-disulfide isomerase/thioredoxin